MSEEPRSAEGPELGEGVELSRLREGEPLLGHVGEEPVVVVRRGDEVHAIGAVCTHYGGPLAEGLVVGETVRCPWHHACFSLRTGEAVGAPALNPVACWRVEVRDGRAFVRGKEEPGPLATHGREAEGPESVVIVGAGAAGSAAAEMLRRQGYTGPITLVDPQRSAPYDRPNLSKDYLAGTAPEEWIPLRPDGFYPENGIERVYSDVTSIDTGAHTVRLADGGSLRYGALLLATGSSPVRLPIPGADLPHVHVLRSLDDARAIIQNAENAHHGVVVGASFIGMESAAALGSRGLAVTVVAPDEVPFERTLGAELGKTIQGAHESHGTTFRLGHTVSRIERDHIVLDDGSKLPAEVVVIGIGVRPDTSLAEKAGLRVDNGVVVNELLETSAKGVYAAGDIARYPDARSGDRIRVEHWVVAQRQGQAAARNILGRRDPFTEPPFFWTQQWEVGVEYVGHVTEWDEVRVDGDLAAGDAAIRYLVGGKERAVATLGRDLESLRVEAEMEAQP